MSFTDPPPSSKAPGAPASEALGQKQRSRTLRFRLTLLVLACVLPVCVVAGFVITYAYQQKRNILEHSVLETTRALSLVVDQELAAVQASETALATSPFAIAGDAVAFDKEARVVLQDYPAGSAITLTEASGQQIVNTYVPLGTPLPKLVAWDQTRKVFEMGKPVIINLYKGALTGRFVVGVAVPVLREGRVKYALMVTVPANHFEALLSQRSVSPDWSATILDGNFVVVARDQREQRYVGIPAVPPLFKAASEAAEGTVESANRAGAPIVAVFHRSPVSGWTVSIGIPKAVMLAGLQQWLWWTGGGAFLLLLVGLALAIFLSRRIAKSIRSLTGPALALGSGAPVKIGPLELAEADEVGQSLAKASQLLEQRTAEREQAQAELQQAKQHAEDVAVQLRSIIENMAERLYVCDAEGHPILTNEAFRKTYHGAGEPEFPQSFAESMEAFNMDGTPVPVEDFPVGRALRGERVHGVEYRWRSKRSGEEMINSYNASPVLDSQGKVRMALFTSQDITDRKQAEQALRRQADLLRLSFDAIIVWRVDGGVESWNIGAEQLYGYTESEAMGRVTHELLKSVHPRPWPQIEPDLRANGFWEGEIHHRTKDDREVVVWARKRLLRGDDGIERVLEANRDITDRKQAEQRIAHLASFPELNPNPIFETDLDGNITYANPSAQRMFPDLFARGAKHPLLENWPAVVSGFKTGTQSVVLRDVEAEGRVFQETIRHFPQLNRVRAYFNDITDRKRAEDALRQSEERWATTLRSIGDAVISTCAQGKIIFMNDVAQHLTGWTLAEAHGKNLETVFDIVNEVTRLKPENPVMRVIRLGQVIGLANHTALVSRNGSECPIEDSAAPIRNQDGEITGVVLVFHDVTEKRKAEQAIRHSDRLATTGRLAATLAHEIHNPLDTVGNLLFLMDSAPDLETARQYAALASDEVARVTQMTRHMLAFQRESTKRVPVNIAEIVDGVVALFDRKIAAAKLQIDKQVCSDGQFLALPSELRQVFANLFGNAVEAVAPNGKVRVRARTARNWQNGQRGLRFLVADNGPGIPAQIRGKIFEPFFTTKGDAGTGLGLWITSGIVEKCGGTLRLRTVTRATRSGTCFSVFLPLD